MIRGLGLACENGLWSNFSCGAGAEVLSTEGARETIQKKKDFPGGSDGKASACMQETPVRSLGWEDSLEKEMATHSSILAWRSPWTEESGRLQSMGSQRVGHD